jgi:YggT family protein
MQQWLPPIMMVIAAVLQIYMLILFIRVVLSWVSMDARLPLVRVLTSLTDPYLNWFRRLTFLRRGNIDLSPLAAFLVLDLLYNAASRIVVDGEITVGIILAIIVRLVWGMVAFVLALLGIASAVRLLAVRLRWGGAGLWAYVDSVLQPPAYAVGRMLRPRSFMSYPTSLLILAIVNLAVWILGEQLVGYGCNLLEHLPF